MSGRDRQPSGSLALFDWVAFVCCLLVLVWAAWAGQRAIALIAALLVVASGIGRLWSRYALRRVSYERFLAERRAFPGEEIALTVRLTNRKPLPVAWLEVADQIPARLRPDSPNWQPSADGRSGFLVHLASLLWYQRISWRYKLRCRRRGYYTLGPARLHGGDPFGFFPRERLLPATDDLIVYPRILPLERLGVLARQPLGEMRAGQPIFEDPSRTVGIREYRPDDALKRIHWKASARRQQLQARVYEPTTTLHTMLVLGLEGFSDTPGEAEDRFELAVTAIASLASHGFAQHQAVGLLVNGGFPDGRACLCLPPAAGREDLTRILEALACLVPTPARPLPELLLEETPKLPWGVSLALVVGQIDDVLLEALRQLQQQGRRASLYSLGSEAAPPEGLGVPVQRLDLRVPV